VPFVIPLGRTDLNLVFFILQRLARHCFSARLGAHERHLKIGNTWVTDPCICFLSQYTNAQATLGTKADHRTKTVVVSSTSACLGYISDFCQSNTQAAPVMSSDSDSEKSTAPTSRRPSYYGGEDKGVTAALQKAMLRLKEKEREKAENPPQLSYLYLNKSASFDFSSASAGQGLSSLRNSQSPERHMMLGRTLSNEPLRGKHNASFDAPAKRRPEEEEEEKVPSPTRATAAEEAVRKPRHVAASSAYFGSSVPNTFRRGYNTSFDSTTSTSSDPFPDMSDTSGQSPPSEPGARWLSYARSCANNTRS
jgi:hypothetical protein